MLSTVKNKNYWFSMDNCFVKASKSYKKYYKLALEVLWIPTLWSKKLIQLIYNN